MEAVKFDQLNTAAYSPRPHTPAALWQNQVELREQVGSIHPTISLHTDRMLVREVRVRINLRVSLPEGSNLAALWV